MSSFNFNDAQAYEFKYAAQWVDDKGPEIFNEIDNDRSTNNIRPHYLKEFFKSDQSTWKQFQQFVQDKNCLEISSGPCGVFPLWAHWLKGKKTIIDPLIIKYEDYLKQKFSRSWFLPEVEKIALGAEHFLPSLEGAIDGCIVWRNGIDHFENWRDALANISRYAKPGCRLLFWGDLIHIEAVDEGHLQKIVDSIPEFEEILIQNGWDIQYPTPSIRDHKKIIDYGCVAIKKGVVPAAQVADQSQKNSVTLPGTVTEQKESLDISDNEISAFVRNLNDAGRSYLRNALDYAEQLKQKIDKYRITREEFCMALELEDHEYDDFIIGARNYTLRDFSKVQDLLYKRSLQASMQEAEKEKLVSFPDYKYSSSSSENKAQ